MYNSSKIDICNRTCNFSTNIILFINSLPRTTAGITIGNQVIRSGTSIGANVEESQNASSRKDFLRGVTIALKEARETEYWLKLIQSTELLGNINDLTVLLQEINELIKILTTIIKNTKANSGIQS